jgi:hypothetical protein
MNETAATTALSREERDLMRSIAMNKYEGGTHPRAAWVEIICPDKKSKAVLKGLCQKGLAETGIGGTVAGDPYTACWLTTEGETVYRGFGPLP